MDRKGIDFREMKERYLELVERLRKDSQISKRNRKLILEFLRDAALGKIVVGRARKRLGPDRLASYVHHLRSFGYYFKKDLDKVQQEDRGRFIEALENSDIRSRIPLCKSGEQLSGNEPIKEFGRFHIRFTIRKFYAWLWGNLRTVPDVASWIGTSEQKEGVPPLTEGEVQTLIDRAKKVRQRALVQTLFDGGFRIGELLNVRLRHVHLVGFDPKIRKNACFLIRVTSTKGDRRTVALPLEETTKWLKHWLNIHPAKPSIRSDGTLEAQDTAAPLFPLSVNAVRLVLSRLGRSSLNKRVYPYLLRHTSATFWASRLSSFELCKRFGWTMVSKMPKRYRGCEEGGKLEVAATFNQELEQRKQGKEATAHSLGRLAGSLENERTDLFG